MFAKQTCRKRGSSKSSRHISKPNMKAKMPLEFKPAKQTKLGSFFKINSNTSSENDTNLKGLDEEPSTSTALITSDSPINMKDGVSTQTQPTRISSSAKKSVSKLKCGHVGDELKSRSAEIQSHDGSPQLQGVSTRDSHAVPEPKNDTRKDKEAKLRDKEGKDKERTTVHQISDSESDSSADTQPETTSKPWTRQGHQSPRRQQVSPVAPSTWSARDTEAYRNGYPNKRDNKSLNDNLKFYSNKIESKPRGTFIDMMHKHWFGDYSLLEEHHGYIQWLFPIREQGMNWQSQELQPHEAEMISGDTKMRERVLRSYEMMLHFWGMHLKNKKTGQIMRGDNWKERFRNLNRSSHNYLRITRMLKSLGELGHEHLKSPFLRFVLQEAIQEKTLANSQRSCLQYWVHTLRNDKERQLIHNYAEELLKKTGKY